MRKTHLSTRKVHPVRNYTYSVSKVAWKGSPYDPFPPEILEQGGWEKCQRRNFRDIQLPTLEEQQRLLELDQGSQEWKEWRLKTPTIGQSDKPGLIEEVYQTFGDKMCFWRGEMMIPTEKIYRPEAKLGHLFEDLNIKLACKRMSIKLGHQVGNYDVGVIYHQKRPYETASLDGLLIDVTTAHESDGSVESHIIEAKCPRSFHFHPRTKECPLKYVIQVTGQLDVCQSHWHPHIQKRNKGILSLLLIPYQKIEETHALIDPKKPWKLYLWEIPFDPRFNQALLTLQEDFLDAYELGASFYQHNPELLEIFASLIPDYQFLEMSEWIFFPLQQEAIKVSLEPNTVEGLLDQNASLLGDLGKFV